MLRISKLADYAVMIVAKMAQQPDRIYSASELVEMTALNLPTVRKLLKTLSTQKILIAKRGAEGGYSLAMQPLEISLVDIIEAVDGKIAFTECCQPDDHHCQLVKCQMSGAWARINWRIRNVLDEVKILEFVMTEKNRTFPEAVNGSLSSK
ncbi:MAG: SUF system Fe-S cluster assembly regulator [Francisellaceae bacterium]